MKRMRFGAIDVGTTKVCTIMADNGGANGLRILGVGIAPAEGMHKGVVVDVNQAKNAIRRSVAQAEQIAGYKLESATIGITGRHITSATRQGAIAITRHDQVVRPGDLKRVLEVARTVQIPTDNQLLHVIPRTYRVDGQDGAANPVGMHGSRLDVETHVISAAITSIQNMTRCIRGIGVEVDDLVLEPLASAQAVLTGQEKQDGVILADIGGGTTDIAIYKDDTVYHTAVLPVAGYQVTRDISVGLGISFEAAEKMKKKYADVTPDNGKDNRGEMTIDEGSTHVSYADMCAIIRARVDELMRLTLLELPQGDYARLVPSGLVLTGGGASLPGIAQLAARITRLPSRVGVPFGLEGVSDALQNPAHATGVGLLQWHLGQKVRPKQEKTEEAGVSSFVTRLLRLFHK